MTTKAGEFEDLGVPVKKAGLMGVVVGPDRTGKRELVYLNCMQLNARLFLLAVDPESGETEQYFSPKESGGWATVLGPDKRIYIGTFGQGLLLRFDPAKPELGIQVIGRPSETETYIWELVVGMDGKLYGCTYGNAKLISYDPATGRMEDLGRMDDTQMYARHIAADAEGNIYVSIGTARNDLILYDPRTRQKRSILPPELRNVTSTRVFRGEEQRVYASITISDETGASTTRLFRIQKDSLIPVESAFPRAIRLADGRVIRKPRLESERGFFTIVDPRTDSQREVEFHYKGDGIGIFVVGMGPDDCVYGSTIMPLEVFRYDPKTEKTHHLGNMPGGEVYSLLPYDDKLYLCYYSGAVMNLYDPKNPTWKWGRGEDCNPRTFGPVGDGHLRPRAMIHGPEGKIYIGSHPPYGQLGGAMAVWDPKENRTIENYRHLVKNQSIVALAYEPQTGLIFGGSGNYGGGGTKPVEKEALFFAFDPRQKKKIFETALVPGAQSYRAICAANGKVFVAVGTWLYIFDPTTMRVAHRRKLPGPQVEISLGLHADGMLYGLTQEAIYSVNPETFEVKSIASTPVPVGCGFALAEHGLYFGSGVHLWRWKW